MQYKQSYLDLVARIWALHTVDGLRYFEIDELLWGCGGDARSYNIIKIARGRRLI